MLWHRFDGAAALAAFLPWISNGTDFQAPERSPFGPQIIADVGFVLFCVSSAFFLLAIFLRFAGNRSPVLDSVSGRDVSSPLCVCRLAAIRAERVPACLCKGGNRIWSSAALRCLPLRLAATIDGRGANGAE
jgi:hypothetical protein